MVGTIDELDVLPRCIDHLRQIGVEEIVVTDVGSTDGSREYVRSQERAGDVWLLEETRRKIPGVRRHLFEELGRAIDADFVLFMDSDEFWLPRGGDIRVALEGMDADIISVPRYNVVLASDGLAWPSDPTPLTDHDMLVWAQTTRDIFEVVQRDAEFPFIRGVNEPKVIVRPAALGTLHVGTHYVTGNDAGPWRHAVASDMIIAHAPFRTLERYEMRSRNAARAVARLPWFYSGGTGWQFRILADEVGTGTSRQGFERQRTSDEDLSALRERAVIRTPREIMDEPVPVFATLADERSAGLAAQPWLGVAAAALEAHGVEPIGKLEHISTGTVPTVLVGDSHVVRLFSPRPHGQQRFAAEAAAMAALASVEQLLVPRLLSQGELASGWHYTISTAIPGKRLADVTDQLERWSRREIAAWLGRWLHQLRATTTASLPARFSATDWRAAVRDRYSSAPELLAGRDLLPARHIEALPAWLPPVEQLLSGPGADALSHGDFDARHVRGPRRFGRRRFEPAGVVGLDDVGARHAMWDVGAIWWSFLRGDPDLTSRFLGAARLPDDHAPDFPRHALAWTLIGAANTSAKPVEIETHETLDDLAQRWFGSALATRGYVEREFARV